MVHTSVMALLRDAATADSNTAELEHHAAPQPTYIHVCTQTASPLIEYVAPAPGMIVS